MNTRAGKLVFAKPMAGTVSRVSRANSEDELTEDTGRLINAHMTAKGDVVLVVPTDYIYLTYS